MVNVDKIIAFENGELDHDEAIDLMQSLIDDGSVWSLQGSYGRLAKQLIDSGECQPAHQEKPASKMAQRYPGYGSGTVGPYIGVKSEAIVTFRTEDDKAGTRTFRVFTYEAYNAYGLVGYENNGVGILDEDGKHVLADMLGNDGTSAWCGVGSSVMQVYNDLISADWNKFRAFVNKSPRARYKI